MYGLRLNHRIAYYDRSRNMLTKSLNAGMNYVTFHKMATGEWNTQALKMLANFLSANGFTAEKLREAKFTDIFMITDVKDARK